MKKAFFEPDCDIGGYSCPAWSDAYEKLRDLARAHPVFNEREIAAANGDDNIEAIDDFAEELAQGLHGKPPKILVNLALCSQPGKCRWAAQND